MITVRSGNSLTISAMLAKTVMPRLDAMPMLLLGITVASMRPPSMAIRRVILLPDGTSWTASGARSHAFKAVSTLNWLAPPKLAMPIFFPLRSAGAANFLARDKAVQILVQERRGDRQLRARGDGANGRHGGDVGGVNTPADERLQQDGTSGDDQWIYVQAVFLENSEILRDKNRQLLRAGGAGAGVNMAL